MEAQNNRTTMVWGILIGVALTILTVVLSMAIGKKNLSPLSYIILVVALVCFSLEGIRCVKAIDDKRNVADKTNTITSIIETAIAFTGNDIQNYRLNIAEATAVRTGIRLVYPKEARYIEPSDLLGKTIYECTEVVKDSIIRSSSSRIWESAIWMFITFIVALLLSVLAMNLGGGHKKSSIATGNDETYTTSNYDDF